MWTWDPNDESGPYTPQGITSFTGTIDDVDVDVVVVSWHSNNGGDARISYLVKAAGATGYSYGHARLGDAGTTANLHAGGIAFFDSQLLVADTDRGVVAFDVTNPQQDNQGVWQVAELTSYDLIAPDKALNRYSFADVDWTDSKAPLLLTGVYVSSKEANTYHPSVLGWKLIAGKGPTTKSPKVFLDDNAGSKRDSFWYLQGVAHHGDTWYLSQSGSIAAIRAAAGDLSGTSPVYSTVATCDLGVEDLHIPPGGQWLWGLTENVKLDIQGLPRLVFRIPISK
jgi:hypothetical protein